MDGRPPSDSDESPADMPEIDGPADGPDGGRSTASKVDYKWSEYD